MPDILEDLAAACDGHPFARIPWPHYLLHAAIAEIRQLRADLKAAQQPLERLKTLHPLADWHEDIGPVLWHCLGEWGDVCEAPIVATGDDDLDSQQPWDGYYTHWSYLPEFPRFPVRAVAIAPPDFLLCDQEGYTDA